MGATERAHIDAKSDLERAFFIMCELENIVEISTVGHSAYNLEFDINPSKTGGGGADAKLGLHNAPAHLQNYDDDCFEDWHTQYECPRPRRVEFRYSIIQRITAARKVALGCVTFACGIGLSGRLWVEVERKMTKTRMETRKVI